MTNDVLSRRLAVIVAADVVGFSRLMEADEAGTLAQLKSIRKELIDPKIAEHRGRLVKTTGDGLLMEFSSVTDGVQSAIEIQEALAERNRTVPTDRRLLFRMGINLGEIITEGEDIYGTGVNVAARLESLADPRRHLCLAIRLRSTPASGAMADRDRPQRAAWPKRHAQMASLLRWRMVFLGSSP